jgi:hypothetical protein
MFPEGLIASDELRCLGVEFTNSFGVTPNIAASGMAVAGGYMLSPGPSLISVFI